MRIKRLVILAAVWTASLVGVGLWAQGSAGANVQQPQTAQLEKGRFWFGPVFTGENFGFMPAPHTAPPNTAPSLMTDKDGRVIGTFVVKVDGKWVEVASPIPLARSAGTSDSK